MKMRRVPQEAVFGTEYPFRTGNACFLHRMLPNIDVQEMAKVSKPTATRLLASLSDYLEVKGTTGKGTHYVVKWLSNGSQRAQNSMDKTSADSCFSTVSCYYSEYYISFADNYKGLIKGS